MSANQQARSANVTTFDIFSNYDTKKSLSVLGGISELHLYESLLDNTVRATAIFTDSGNRFGQKGESALEKGDIQLTAGEKTNLVVEDNYGQSLKFVNDYHLRIKEVRNIVEHNKKSVFTIDFYSKEVIDNEIVDNRVLKRYDGNVSDSVYKILKTDYIKTKKTFDIDRGLNSYNVIGGTQKPFDLINTLATRCVPEIQNASGNLAGYFFYEVADNGTGRGGFKFKSIDKLFQQTAMRKLIFNNTTSIPLGYDAKILEYKFDNTVDLDHQLFSGGLLSTQLRTWNPYNHAYEQTDFNAEKQLLSTGGVDPVVLGKDINLQEYSTQIYVKQKDTGSASSGTTIEKQLEKSKELNFDVDAIFRQSKMRYNNLFTTLLTITIPGDFGLSAGDLVHCDFPAVSTEENQEISYRKSGLYMIVDLCHFIRGNPGQTFTKLNLVRDSIGRKPF
jgi:hypothetical protein